MQLRYVVVSSIYNSASPGIKFRFLLCQLVSWSFVMGQNRSLKGPVDPAELLACSFRNARDQLDRWRWKGGRAKGDKSDDTVSDKQRVGSLDHRVHK